MVILIFWGTAKLFSTVTAHHFKFLPAGYKGSDFPTSFWTLVTACPFGSCHLVAWNYILLWFCCTHTECLMMLNVISYYLKHFCILWARFSLSLWCHFQHKSLKIFLINSNLFIIFFCCYIFGVIYKIPLPDPWLQRYTHMFSSMTFILLALAQTTLCALTWSICLSLVKGIMLSIKVRLVRGDS
jgi:hypothetical protein